MDINVKLKSSAQEAKKALTDVAKSTSKLGRETKSTNSGMAKFFTSLRKNDRLFNNIAKDANRASISIGGFGKALKGIASIAVLNKLGQTMFTAIKASMDMIETQNLFEVSLGKTNESAEKLLETISKSTGMDLTNMKSAVGTYALLARSMGMVERQGEILSTGSTQLAMDLSSLTNVPLAQALGDIKSGLIGQTETMYKYGVDLTEAALKTQALEQGITKSVRQMTQGEKMALRYNLMLKQTSLAHGDMAKTIDTLANQWRILSERVVTASRSIGSIFIPIMTQIMPVANAVLIVVTQLADAIAKVMGYSMPKTNANVLGAVSDGAEEATDDIEDAKKALDKFNSALGFDELNTISKDDSSGVAGVSTPDVTGMDLSIYDAGLTNIKAKADEIASIIMDTLKSIDTTNLQNSIAKVAEAFTPLSDTLGSGLKWIYDNVLVPLGQYTISDLLPAFLDLLAVVLTKLNETLLFFAPMWQYVWNTFFLPVATWTGEALITGLQALQDVISNLSFENIGTAVSDFLQAPVVGQIYEAFSKAWTDISSLGSPLYNWLTTDVFTLFGTIITNVQTILVGLWDTISFAVGDVWNLVIMPFIDGIVVNLLPVITSLATETWNLFGVMFVEIKKIFDSVWKDGIIPVFELAGKIWTDLTTTIKEKWDEYGAPIFEAWKTAVQSASDVMQNLWKKILKPIWTSFMDVLDKFWTGHMKPLVDKILEFVATSIKASLEFYSKFIKPIVNWIVNVLAPPITEFFDQIFNVLEIVFGVIADVVGGIIEMFTGVIEFFMGVFTGDWKRAWDGIKKYYEGIWNAIYGVVKGVVNLILDTVERMINNMIKGLNFFINKINSVLEKINSVAGELGFSINLSLNTIDEVKLPRLAMGGSLQAGQIFEAGEGGNAEAIGSYKGKTTVMPLENTDFVNAIYNAVKDAMEDVEGSGGQNIENILMLDGEVIYKNQQKVKTNRGRNYGLGAFSR